jgi:NADPH:quinone reductase-like Zn-dependent oxidoreductase
MAAAEVVIPKTQRAIMVVDAIGTLRVVDDAPVMKLEPDAVLVKTVALALNPVDTKMSAGFAVPGAILGYDFTLIPITTCASHDLPST